MFRPCNKMSFVSADDARKDQKLRAARYGSKAKDMKKQRAYECQYCGKFHMTSMSKVAERRMMKSRYADS